MFLFINWSRSRKFWTFVISFEKIEMGNKLMEDQVNEADNDRMKQFQRLDVKYV